MRRRISLLLAALLAGTTLMLFGPAQPASAVVVCGGAGTVSVNPGLLYPVLIGVGIPPTNPANKDHTIDILIGNQVNRVHGFVFSFIAGSCVHVRVPPTTSNIVANGSLKGYCGHSSGFGTISGEPFGYVSVGTLLILTGHVVGLASAIPTPLTGSCLHAEGPTPTTTFGLPGGATLFNVQGAGVAPNCTNALAPTEQLVTAVNTLALPTQTLGVHVTAGIHIYTVPPCTNPNPVL